MVMTNSSSIKPKRRGFWIVVALNLGLILALMVVLPVGFCAGAIVHHELTDDNWLDSLQYGLLVAIVLGAVPISIFVWSMISLRHEESDW